jgi:endonuclease/exonuclease/phosphatase (EEP) superfamily protein YafD
MPIRPLVAWPLAALCLAWAAVRLLGLERGFPMVAVLSWTPIAAAAAVLVVVVAAVLRQRAAAVVALLAAVALVAVVAPRALGGPSGAEGGSGPSLRVLTTNMRLGHGSPEALVRLVRRQRPDVVSVQELTPALEHELDEAGLTTVLPHTLLRPVPGGSGIGLYSRLPLEPRSPPGGTVNPVLVAALRLPGAAPVELYAIHIPPPVHDSRVSDWRADLRRVPRATPDGPVRVLAGDFNATLDHAELRRVLDGGYEDAAAEVGAGLRATWPRGRLLPPVTIDHVLADRRCGVRAVDVVAVPGSDHRAVLAELVLPRG